MIPIVLYMIPAFLFGVGAGKLLPDDPVSPKRQAQLCVLDALDKKISLTDALEGCK